MSAHNIFKRVAGAFFRVSDEGLKAVSNPSTLRGLISGDISSTSEATISGGADRFAGTTTNPAGTASAGTTIPFQPQGGTTGGTTGGTIGDTTGGTTSGGFGNEVADNFNLLLAQILKKAQGIDNTELLTRRRALQRAAVGRAQEITPEELRTLSPAQQNAIRTGDINAILPDLDKASVDIASAQQQSDLFFKKFELVKDLGEEFTKNMVASDEELQSLKKSVEAGLITIQDVLTLSNEPTVKKLLTILDPSQIKEKEGGQFTLGKEQTRFDAEGNIIARGSGVSTGGGETGGVSIPPPIDLSKFDSKGVETAQFVKDGGGSEDNAVQSLRGSGFDDSEAREIASAVFGTSVPTGQSVAQLGEAELIALEFRLGKQIFGTRISDAEGKKVSKFVKIGVKQGWNENQLVDAMLGFNVQRNEPLGRALQAALLNFRGDAGLADFDNVGLARLLNADNTLGAVTKVENSGMSFARDLDPDGFMGEGTAIAAVQRSNGITDLVNQLDESPIGVVSGTMENWLGRLRGPEASAIRAKITSAIAEMRKRLLGSAVTETEQRFLAPKVPDLSDRPETFMIKLQELATDPLLQLNSTRSLVGLPQLDENSLINKNLRSDLYLGKTLGTQNFSGQPQNDQGDIDSFLNSF